MCGWAFVCSGTEEVRSGLVWSGQPVSPEVLPWTPHCFYPSIYEILQMKVISDIELTTCNWFVLYINRQPYANIEQTKEQ